MSVLVVVPARGGSTGIPLKNLREIGGKTLVRLAVECAYEAGLTNVVVSSDHMGILKEAVACGATAHIRPDDLSNGMVGDTAVLRDAVGYDRNGCDTIVMLQPTSPLRRPEHVIGALDMMKEGWDSVWTVSPTPLKYHPAKALSCDDSRLLYYHWDGANILARQQLLQTYHRNGVAYVMTRDCLMEHGTMGKKCGAYVVEGEQVSIDTEDDLRKAEELWRTRRSRT